jgi:hypothetical protein
MRKRSASAPPASGTAWCLVVVIGDELAKGAYQARKGMPFPCRPGVEQGIQGRHGALVFLRGMEGMDRDQRIKRLEVTLDFLQRRVHDGGFHLSYCACVKT